MAPVVTASGAISRGATVKRPVAGPVLAGAVLLGACAGLALVDPSGGPTICPFKAATGLDCPGCGTTRAAHKLLTGHFFAAADMNVLALVSLPLIAWALFASLTRAFGGPRVRTYEPSSRVVWVALAVVAVFWVIRNLPWAPFAWMSTTS
jgi:hypothetical protein